MMRKMMMMLVVVVRKSPSVSLLVRGIGFHCRHVVMTYVWVLHISLVDNRSRVTALSPCHPTVRDSLAWVVIHGYDG